MDDDPLDQLEPGDRRVGDVLEVDRLPAPEGDVADEQHARAGVDDAIAQRGRPQAGVDHRVDRADPRAGQHRDDPLDRQRHVDANAVAGAHAVGAQGVGDLADLREQRGVRHPALLTGLAEVLVGERVGMAAGVPVQTRDGRVQPAVREPVLVLDGACKDRRRFDRPGDALRGRAPVRVALAQRGGDERVLVGNREPARDARRRRHDLAGREQAFDGRRRGHGGSSDQTLM